MIEALLNSQGTLLSTPVFWTHTVFQKRELQVVESFSSYPSVAKHISTKFDSLFAYLHREIFSSRSPANYACKIVISALESSQISTVLIGIAKKI